MIPVSLHLQGFLSYLDPVSLDFTAFRLACISGPNGAGKSSLLDAITWALFGQARRRDDQIIHTRASAATVEFVFDLAGLRYRIQRTRPRGKPQVLELHVWAPERNAWRALTERRVRDTQAKIEALLGLDYRTFVQASFFLQGQADNFARQSPAERKETLARVLGLDQWEAFAARARERRRAAEADLQRLDAERDEARRIVAQREHWQARLEEVQQALQALARQRHDLEASLRAAEALRAQAEAAQRRVAEARQALEQAQAEQAQAERQLAAVRAELQELDALLARAETIRQDAQRRAALQREVQTWDERARRYQALHARYAQAEAAYREARARLQEEREHLLRRRRDARDALQHLAALQDALKDLDARLAAAQGPDPDTLRSEQQALAEEQARLEAENRELRAAMDERKARLERLRAVEGATCPLCGQPLTDDHRREIIVRLEEEGQALARRYRANRARLQDLRAQRQAYAQRIAQAREAQARRQALERERAARLARLQALQSQVETWQTRDEPRLAAVERLLAEEAFAPEVRQRLQELRAALDALGYDPEAHEQARAALQALDDAEAALRRLAQAEAQRAALEARRQDWEAHLQQARERVAQAQAALQAAEDEAARVAAAAPDLDALQARWHAVVAQERARQQELGAAQQQLAFIESQAERLARLEAQRATLAQRIGRYREVERACSKNGVPALLIEQALPHLEAEANDLLARLTDGEMHLTFRTQAAYKNPKRKDLRETLEIVVSDANGERAYETFSGGEAFRINFAIRLALARVLARRAGAQVRLLVIDEGFGSQDDLGRQRLVEAINRIQDQFSHILVITHIAALRERFPVRIEVEKRDGRSRLQVVSA